jgi:hypothetical protein
VRTTTCAVCLAALLRASTPAAAAAPPAQTSLLLSCLEPIARTFHVRIVDNSARSAPISCQAPQAHVTLEQAMDRLLQPNGLSWRRLEDGTLEVIAAPAKSQRVKLPALAVEGEPVATMPRPETALATPLIEHASALTTLDQHWLDTGPLLGFNQIGWYAPNVYGSGQSLAIRGTERDTDYFPALTVMFDGIELGTRLLDDELIPLADVTNLTLARGPRAFEFGADSEAGMILLNTAPPAVEASANAAFGIGNLGARNAAAVWSGPLPIADFTATLAVDRHDIPGFVQQVAVPQANVDERRNNFARFKLAYSPDSGLSAQLSALALSGDSSDRQIVAPAPVFGGPPSTFDPFDRYSYAQDPIVAQTHARGAAGYLRYERADRWTIQANASATSITRDSTLYPRASHWSDHELRRRASLTMEQHPAADWTILAGLEQDYISTLFHTPPAEQLRNYFAASTDSASIWAEHAWSAAWTTGLGARWLYERSTESVSASGGYGYRVPIPLAVVDWHPRTEHSLVLSYGTGFRSGGQVSIGGIPYAPERSENVELSWRAQWFDGTLHTALTAFDGTVRNRYTYLSSNSIGDPILARVRDRGIEFELDDELSDHWRVRAGFGALNSRFSSFVYRYGDPTSEAPPQTATIGVRYGLAQGWYAAADAYHAAGAEYYNPSGRLPGYEVLSLRIGYRTGKWDTALIATNALDAEYIARVQLSAGEVGYRLGDPRRVECLVRRSW